LVSHFKGRTQTERFEVLRRIFGHKRKYQEAREICVIQFNLFIRTEKNVYMYAEGAS
jgi:hypothetical protein